MYWHLQDMKRENKSNVFAELCDFQELTVKTSLNAHMEELFVILLHCMYSN